MSVQGHDAVAYHMSHSIQSSLKPAKVIRESIILGCSSAVLEGFRYLGAVITDRDFPSVTIMNAIWKTGCCMKEGTRDIKLADWSTAWKLVPKVALGSVRAWLIQTVASLIFFSGEFKRFKKTADGLRELG